MANSLNKVTTKSILDATVATADIAADAITGAKIADDAIDSEHYTDGSIDTAHIADNQVTLAKMAGGTDGQIITYDASGDPVAVGPGTDGQVLTSTGAGSPPAFETPAAGVGGATGADFNDNVKLRFGTGNDLEIFHDASHSYIKDNGTGNLKLIGGQVHFMNTAADEYMLIGEADGPVTLYHNGIGQLSTKSDGVEVKPDVEGGEAVIYQTADQGDDNADKWLLKATNGGGWHVQNYSSGSWANNIVCATSDAVTLYYNGSTKLATINTGVNITGGIRLGGNNAANEMDDYEEGDWNPVLYGLGSAGTTTYTTRSGSYTKIGNLVTVNIYLNWSNQTGSGDMAIGSMPFTRKSGSNYETVGTAVFSNWDYNGTEQTFGYMGDSTILHFRSSYDSEPWAGVQHDSAGELMVSVTYRTT